MDRRLATSMLLAISTAVVATSGHAITPLLSNSQSAGDAVYTVITSTPDNQPLLADELMVLTGKTCDTLTVQSDVYSTLLEIPVKPAEDPLSSDDLIQNFGPALGCIKVDIFYGGGKKASTGNIALTWDQETKQYVAASPNISNMQF